MSPIFRIPLFAGVSALSLSILAGCVDDSYDLSDIDTTTQLKVNDLTIPVNLKSITLDNVIDVDEQDPDATVKYVTVGGQRYFAIEKHGSLHADVPEVARVTAPEPGRVKTIEEHLSAIPSDARDASVRFAISEDHTDFTYRVGQKEGERVDPAINTIQAVEMDTEKLRITVSLALPDISASVDRIEFTDLLFRLPDGMDAVCEQGTVNGNMLSVPSLTANGSQATLELTSGSIDFRPQYGQEGIKVENQGFDYTSDIYIVSGDLLVYPRSGGPAVPSQVRFTVDYDMSAFVVSRFSGNIDYSSDAVTIDPVSLSDLPDFLEGDDTNLIMSNPQILLSVANPVGRYGLGCTAGLTITPVRDGAEAGSQTLPGGFSVGHDRGDGPYSILMAPRPDDAVNVPAGAEAYTFPGLGHILEGNGLPDQLRIKVSDDRIPLPRIHGQADGLPLGVPFGDVDGEYSFLSLLALDDGSRIVYEKRDDGWSDEDLDALEISSFTITAEATTDIPCTIRLWARPLGAGGADIPLDNPSEAETLVGPMAQAQPLAITMKGDIRHLDGIHFIATAETFDGQPLRPEQYIRLDNIRATVTGTYTKKL